MRSRRRLRSTIWRGDTGATAIEFGLIVPIVVLLLTGVAGYFVICRDDYRSKRATYTAADIIARQKTVSDNFLTLVKSIATRMAFNDKRTLGLRVSSIKKTDQTYTVEWSYATEPFSRLDNGGSLPQKIPDIGNGETIIAVETSAPYTPMFGLLGSTSQYHLNASFARPRAVNHITKAD